MNRGDIIEGRIILNEEVGKGGFGNVWKAFDRHRGETVAIKELKKRWCGSPRMVGLFRKEFIALERLSHPNIVRPLSFINRNGHCLIVMEFLEGGTLEDRIARRGVMEVAEALFITRKLLDVIKACGRLGIVHGDIKPSNILFSNQGLQHPKLGDFGLVNRSEDILNPLSCGNNNRIYGTIAYMPPEKLEGKKPSIRGDIYSLGMTLYKMLTGRLFFNDGIKDHNNLMRAVCNPCREKPSRYRRDIPRWVDDLVMGMIPAEAHKRLKSAVDIDRLIVRNLKTNNR